MKSLKKFSFILSLVGIFCLNTISFSWAQKMSETNSTDIVAQSYSEFTKSKGFNDLSSALKSIENNEAPSFIMCGDSIVCDTKVNKCIVCEKISNDTQADAQINRYSIEYKCVNKKDDPSKYNERGSNFLSSYSWETICTETTTGGTNFTNINGWKVFETINCMLSQIDGKTYCFSKVGENLEITYGNTGKEGKAFRNCEVLPVKLYNHRTCFFCPLFTVIYRAAVNITSISFEKLAISFATLIAVGLAIWIAFQTLTNVSSLTKQDAPKFLSGIIKQSYKFLIAFLLLQYSGQTFNYIINPILKSGMIIGTNLLTNQVNYSNLDENSDESQKQQVRVAEIPEGYYGRELYKTLDSFVTNLQREIAFMQVIGSSLVCTGSNLMWTVSLTDFGDGFQMFIQGAVIAIFGFLLSIAFAFYIMDAVVQLGVVGALMPFLIACWPFKITSKYTTTGFNMILNSFFIFVFIGLVISVSMNLIDSSLEMTSSSGVEENIIKDCMSSNSNMTRQQCENIIKETGALAKIYIAINNQSDQTLRDLTDISGIGFLILIFCCIFGFKFIGQTSSLAGQFASSPMKPIAPSFATMGASAALGTAKKVTKPIREAVSDKAENIGINFIRAIPTAPARLYRGTKKAANAVSNFFRGKKGRANNEAEKAEEKSKNKVGNNQKISNSQAPVPVEQKNNPSEKTTNGTPKVQQGKPREENATDNLEKTLKANESPERKAKNHSEKAKNSSKDNRKRNRDKRKRAHRR